jgi:hypothetical protein
VGGRRGHRGALPVRLGFLSSSGPSFYFLTGPPSGAARAIVA